MFYCKREKETKEFKKLSQLVLVIITEKVFRHAIALFRYFSIALGIVYFTPYSVIAGLCVAAVLHYIVRDFYPIFSMKEKRLECENQVSTNGFLLSLSDSKTTLSKGLEMEVINYFSGETKEELENESSRKGFLTVYDISRAFQLDKQLKRRPNEKHWEQMQWQAFQGNATEDVDRGTSLLMQSIKRLDLRFVLKSTAYTTAFIAVLAVGVPPFWDGALGGKAVEAITALSYTGLTALTAGFVALFFVGFDIFMNYSNLKRSLRIKNRQGA